MGDFNFPKIDWKNWLTKGDKISENFVESIRDSYMFQHNFISSDFSFLLIYNVAPRLLKLVDSLRNSS
jgi:hypothetical protein